VRRIAGQGCDMVAFQIIGAIFMVLFVAAAMTGESTQRH
jgi:hypothetical protein